jgi:hypothetical protein
MEKYLATITVYKNDVMMFTDKVLTQWISIVASTYVDIDNSPYKVVLEINGNIITLDPTTEQQVRSV